MLFCAHMHPKRVKKQNPASHFPGNIPQMNPEMPRKADMRIAADRLTSELDDQMTQNDLSLPG